MANDKKPPATPETPDKAAAGAAPAAPPQLNTLSAIQEYVRNLHIEVRTLEGRIKNNDPAAVKRLNEENQALRDRLAQLEKALSAMITDALAPRSADEAGIQYEALRKAAVDYFTKSKINPDLWKNIAS